MEAQLEAAIGQAHAEMRRLIHESHLEMSRLQLHIETLKAQLDAERFEQGLQLPAPEPSLSLVMALKKPLPLPPRGRRSASKHPFPRAVGNVKLWAKQNGYSYAAVKSWFTEGETIAPVPRDVAIRLFREYRIPQTSWRGGITDDLHTKANQKLIAAEEASKYR